jgi:hypothetical protein
MVPRLVDTHCGRERPWYRHRCLPLCIQPDAYPSEPGADPPDIAMDRTLLPHQPSSTCHSSSGNLPSNTHASQIPVMLLVYVARWCVPAHSSCIGNNTAAHELVHLVGMPPGGHSTPVVQQLSVTVWMNARNSGKDAQLAGAVGTVGAVSQTRTPRK